MSGDAKYLTAAADVFSGMAAEYDTASGVFSSQDTYTVDDVAVIMGAVNSLKLFGGSAVNQDKAEEIFTGFFESAVNLSGLQQSAPPKDVAKGTFEQDEPDIYYAYPGMPMPPMAGGDFGIAPVFATEVKWDGQPSYPAGRGWDVPDPLPGCAGHRPRPVVGWRRVGRTLAFDGGEGLEAWIHGGGREAVTPSLSLLWISAKEQ